MAMSEHQIKDALRKLETRSIPKTFGPDKHMIPGTAEEHLNGHIVKVVTAVNYGKSAKLYINTWYLDGKKTSRTKVVAALAA